MTRRRLFLAFFLAAAAALVWPVYPWAAARLPALFGLPGFFAWPVIVLAAMFVALVWLYRSEGTESAGDAGRGGPGGPGGRADHDNRAGRAGGAGDAARADVTGGDR